MRRSRDLGKATLPQPPHRAHRSLLAWGLTFVSYFLLLLRTWDRRKYSRHFLTWSRFLQNGALSERAVLFESIPEHCGVPDETAPPCGME